MKKWMIICFVCTVHFVQAQGFKTKFPYQQAGLDKHQAAIHLLSRFTYGFDEDDIKKVEKEGLENWFKKQLKGKDSEKISRNIIEKNYPEALWSNIQIDSVFPKNFKVRQMAIRAGFVNKDSVGIGKNYNLQIRKFMESKGYRPESELINAFLSAKIVQALYTENPVREILTDFWFNHFNVSFTKNQTTNYIPNYEASVIRPNALGSFPDLVLATAKSPAMLTFLDNNTSVAFSANGKRGLNENYARELMELHTLSVDGGYSQKDVTEAARVLTGWTMYGSYANNPKRIQAIEKNPKNYHDGDFLFLDNTHDKGTKTVLGHVFNSNGYQEGVDLINMLSESPQTAQFISKKLAVRFVADTPSVELIQHMKDVFLQSNGDIPTVLWAMVSSPYFWERKNINNKIKTPFELAISAVKTTKSTVEEPLKLNNWITRMGEKKYYYIAPTGFPDQSSYWINTGSLLNRMNFGLSFSTEKSSGVEVDVLALNNGHEPANVDQAIQIYGEKMLPYMNLDKLKNRIEPLLAQQNLKQKVANAAQNKTQTEDKNLHDGGPDGSTLSQVLGLIIGSPEFQRR